MGMPIITPGTGTRGQAVTDLIQSVALQETALSHIMNAEGEKMQAIIAAPGITVDQLFELNNYVNKMLNTVNRLEMMFQAKLELFSDTPATPSATMSSAVELANIHVPYVNIDVPFGDPAAEGNAIDAAMATAQTQLKDGYTVTFNPEYYGIDPDGDRWILTGTFTVSKDGVPADTATNDRIQIIEVITSALPATTAAAELAKIALNNVTIALPLTDPGAQQAAVDSAVQAAQTLIDPGFTASFNPTGYVAGMLSGYFTVTNTNVPADTATNNAVQNINVISSAPATTAAAQLADIHVPAVNIGLPLNDPLAIDSATANAVALAQTMVAPGYTVSYVNPAAYSYVSPALTGTLTIRFVVTNNSDPLDTATTAAPGDTVTVTHPAANATATATAQLLGGTLLSSLSTPVLFAPAYAQYINNTTPGTKVVSSPAIDTGVLNGNTLNLGGLPIDMGNLFQLGLANQYAEADIDGASKAYAGAVSNSGVLSPGGTAQLPANATVDLTQIIPAANTDIITNAVITFGAITGIASWNAGIPNSLARSYNIASAALDIVSPLIGQFVAAVDGAVNTLANTVGGFGTQITNGVLGALTSSINTVANQLPGISIGKNTLTTTVTLDPTGIWQAFLTQPIALPDNSIIVDLSTGSILIDLSKFWGGTLNNLPVNSPLFGPAILAALENGKTALLEYFTAALSDLLAGLLNAVQINISGHITLLEVLGVETAGLDVSFNGTLLQLTSGNQKLTLTGTGAATVLNPVLGGLADTIMPLILTTINDLFFTPGNIVNVGWQVANLAVTTLLNAVSPVFTLIAQVISININVQTQTTDTFTEIPLRFSLLDGTLGSIDISKVTVGPNSYTPV